MDEVLELELSNFARLLRLRPAVDDNHVLVQEVVQADGLYKGCTRKDGQKESDIIRRGPHGTGLRTKPHTNSWLYVSPRVCTLGEDAFEHVQR